VRGVVNTLNVTTIGAVVGPGDPLVEIVPVDDHLLIEARISPQDVAFLRPGDPASVKITAFDYVVYGSLSGTVERIGADTLTDEDGNAFFQVAVRTDSTDLGGNQISPGMVAQVDIQTGRKTVLDYLLNPFLRVRDEALRER
jgi:adhesin transport system membrane fusion protein